MGEQKLVWPVLVPFALACLAVHAIGAGQPYVVALTLSGNNQSIIEDALQSAVGWVDAVVLFDTGISDDTIDVASKAVGSKLTVSKLTWPGSYAEARNRALQTAADIGAVWGVFLDPDERFEGDTSNIRGFLESTTADVVTVWHNSLTSAKPRFFRLPAEGKFAGPTQEKFQLQSGSTTAEMQGIFYSQLLKDQEAVRQEAEQDVELLLKYTAEHPTEPYWWFVLGDAYTNLGRDKDAVKAFQSCTDLRGDSEEGAWAMYRAAQSLAAVHQYDQALDALATGMNRDPAMPELPWYASYLSFQVGKHQQAAQWARLATVHGCHVGTCPRRAGFQFPFARYEGPYDMLRWSLRALGDEQGATEAEIELKTAIAKRELSKLPAGPARKEKLVFSASECPPPPGKQATKPRIALGFTTAKRPNQFIRTYLTFRARCLDCSEMITDWYAVDDGSSGEQLAAMKEAAPNIKWIEKPAGQRGHVSSINAMLAVAIKYDYFVWMEDDWLWVKDAQFVTRALDVMQTDPNIAQVLFNNNYRNTDHPVEANGFVEGQYVDACGTQYVLHDWCGYVENADSTKCSEPGKLSHRPWPHFSLLNGLWKMLLMSKLGPVEDVRAFEGVHAGKYVAQGYKTAFLPEVHSIHLAIKTGWRHMLPGFMEAAAETYAKHGITLEASSGGQSAYDLLGTSR